VTPSPDTCEGVGGGGGNPGENLSCPLYSEVPIDLAMLLLDFPVLSYVVEWLNGRIQVALRSR
jgi:hypothetical protein